jgi:site-specific DNA recombinase
MSVTTITHEDMNLPKKRLTKLEREQLAKTSITYEMKKKKVAKNKNTGKRRVAIYKRVSMLADQSVTFERQHDEVITFLKSNGIDSTNSEIVVFEEAESAYQNKHRYVLQEMAEQTIDNKFDDVAFYDIDRISRKTKVSAVLDSIFKEAQVKVWVKTLGKSIDTTTIEGGIIWNIMSMMAEHYSRQTSDRTTGGHRVRANAGVKRNSVTPFGLKDKEVIVDSIGGLRKVYELDTDVQSNYPEEFNNKAAVVKEIYRKYNDGQSLKSIARWLNENIPTIKAKSWDDSTVKYILRNPVYFGGSHYKKQIVKDANGNFLITNEALVTLEYWTDTQTLINHNTRVYKSKKIRHTRSMSPLHYIAKCECGGQLKRNTSAVRGTPFYSLKCVVPTIDKSRCNGVGISQEQLEKEIFEYTKDILSNPELLKHFVNNNNQVETRVVSKDEQRILDEINQLNSRIEIEQLDMVKQLLVTEVANKKAELNKMKMSSNIIINKVKNNNITIEAFEAAWNSDDKSDINALLSTIYKSIIISKSTISTSELNKLKKDGWFVDPKRVTIELHNGDKIRLDAQLV